MNKMNKNENLQIITIDRQTDRMKLLNKEEKYLNQKCTKLKYKNKRI